MTNTYLHYYSIHSKGAEALFFIQHWIQCLAPGLVHSTNSQNELFSSQHRWQFAPNKAGLIVSFLGRQGEWAAPTAGLPQYFPHTTCVSLYSAPGLTILVAVSHQIMSSVVFSALSTMPGTCRNDYGLKNVWFSAIPETSWVSSPQ